VTGHSLGGGLASAATMAGGLQAETFNAAGLHQNTIGRIPNVQPHQIRAYYIDWDLLSFAQDHLNFVVSGVGIDVPSASGIRQELDGPYDNSGIDEINPLELLGFLIGPRVGLGLAVGSRAWLMAQSHLNTHVLYGILVDEGAGIDLLGKPFPFASDVIGEP